MLFLRWLSLLLLKFTPQPSGRNIFIALQINKVVVAKFLIFNKFKQAFLQENISLKWVNEQHFKTQVLQVLFLIFKLEGFLELSLLSLRDKHKILRLKILIDHFDLVLRSFIELVVEPLSRFKINMHAHLIVVGTADHRLDITNVLSYLLLLAFEQIAELSGSHHLAVSILEVDQNNALVLQIFLEFVVLSL